MWKLWDERQIPHGDITDILVTQTMRPGMDVPVGQGWGGGGLVTFFDT